MAIDKQDVCLLSARYWVGADKKRWEGRGLKRELANLGVPVAANHLQTVGDLERHLLGAVHDRIESDHQLGTENLLLITSWKSDRAVPCVASNDRLSGTIAAATHRAFADNLGVTDRLAELTKLHGVGIRLASAVLTVFRPAEYSVLDWRALDTLKQKGETTTDDSGNTLAFGDRRPEWWDGHYGSYLAGCLAIADREGVILRDLDRSLWRFSFEAKRLGEGAGSG